MAKIIHPIAIIITPIATDSGVRFVIHIAMAKINPMKFKAVPATEKILASFFFSGTSANGSMPFNM